MSINARIQLLEKAEAKYARVPVTPFDYEKKLRLLCDAIDAEFAQVRREIAASEERILRKLAEKQDDPARRQE